MQSSTNKPSVRYCRAVQTNNSHHQVMSESNQGLPPLTSHGVFTASASSTIDAPRDIAWQVLMDWASYHEWCAAQAKPHCHDLTCFAGTLLCTYNIDSRLTLGMTPKPRRSRNQCLTDGSKQPLGAAQQTPRAGAHLLIHPVHIPPSFDPPAIFPASSVFVIITAMDPDNYRCAWETADYPPWLLHSVRWQMLTEVVEDGRKKTRYESIEVFNGVLAYAIKYFVGSGLQQGFTAMAEGLKKRSEELQERRQG